MRIKARQWLLAKARPKIYGDRPEPNADHESVHSWAVLLKAVDGKSRGLPNARQQQLPPPLQEYDDEVE
jgi:hypothetical protein